MPAISIENVSKQFPTTREPLTILRDVSLQLEAGQNVAVVGPSGSGKSTLLHVIGGLDAPSSGKVLIKDQDPYSLSEPELARFRNGHVGFIFQDHHLLPQLTVLENVLIPVMAQGPIDPADVARANDLIQRVGLTERVSHRPAELSGGERERVAVARAMIRNPIVLLADEPTGNLDKSNASKVAQLLLELQKSESTMLIIVTHSPELAAMMQKRVLLDDGKLTEVS